MKVTAEQLISDVLSGKVRAAEVLMNHGSNCMTCGNIFYKTVADMAAKHKVDLNMLLEELNNLPDASNA